MTVEPPTTPIDTDAEPPKRLEPRRCGYNYGDGDRCDEVVRGDLRSLEGHKRRHEREAAVSQRLKVLGREIDGLRAENRDLRRQLKSAGTVEPATEQLEDWTPDVHAPAEEPVDDLTLTANDGEPTASTQGFDEPLLASTPLAFVPHTHDDIPTNPTNLYAR